MKFFSNIIKSKKYLIIFLLILVLSSLGIFFLGVGEAKAFDLISIAFDTVAWIIARIGAIIHAIVSLFFWLCAMLLELAFGLEGFTNAGIVKIGWAITRDLANMFFALILLIIAFATILRIETYGIKQILWRLVVAALLINFSLVLAGVIIDFSQVLTHFFYDQVKASFGISAQLANVLGMSKIPKIIPEATGPEALAAGISGILMMIFSIFLGIIMIILAGFALVIGAFFLIVRLIALWILLIFAPLAWLCMIMPATRSLWNKWWSEFLKWAFFAPIYAFFVFLAIKAGDAGSFTGIIQQEMENIVAKSGWAATLGAGLMASPRLFLQFLVVVGLLFGGVIVGQRMGVFGAGAMIAAGKGVSKVPLGALDRWLAKGAEKKGPGIKVALRRAGSYLSPAAWKKAWEQRQIQKERESIPVAAGERQDLMSRIITWGILRPLTLRKIKLGEKTDYAERAKRARYIGEEKEIFTTNAEEMVAAADEALKADNPYKAVAYLRRLAAQTDENEYMRNLAKLAKSPEEAAKYTADAEGLVNLIEEKLKPLMGEQDAYRQGHDIGRILESVGAWSGRPFRAEVDAKGNIKYRIADPTIDDPTGEIVERVAKKYEISPERILEELKKPWQERSKAAKEASGEMARKFAHIEWSKREAQEQMRFTRRFSFIHEGYEAGTGQTIDYGMHEDGEEKMAVYLATQAARLDSHVKANWMFNHVEELKEINPPLYKALVEDFSKMAKEQIEKLKTVVAKPGPGVVRTDWTPEKAKEELERLGGPEKKK